MVGRVDSGERGCEAEGLNCKPDGGMEILSFHSLLKSVEKISPVRINHTHTKNPSQKSTS